MTNKEEDLLHTIHSQAADMMRWALSAAIRGSLSNEVRARIHRAAMDIARRVEQ